MPAAPASDPARRNVTEIVRFTSMPIIAEASVSWETARIAFPCFVERTNQERPTRSGITMINTEALLQEYDDVADVDRIRARDEVRHACGS